jgi:hypothetical protein
MKIFPLAGKLLVALSFAVVVPVHAQLVGIAGHKKAPELTYGGYTMTSFKDDTRPVFDMVSGLETPVGGSVNFGKNLSHYEIGNGWLTWSNGYSGDVYFNPDTSSLTLTLPSFTKAFYFYTESNAMSNHRFTVSSGDVVLKENINGEAGAEIFAFYGTGSAFVSTITISCDDTLGFAIGEFGIARAMPVPEPGTYALVGAAGLIGLFVVRRIRRKAS